MAWYPIRHRSKMTLPAADDGFGGIPVVFSIVGGGSVDQHH